MKKYVKPMIVLERYELSRSIAACAWVMQFPDEKSCRAYAGGSESGMSGSLFSSALACTYPVSDDFGQEDYCYQTGSGDLISLFQS